LTDIACAVPTTLDRAINNANEDIVEMLLERGASVSIFDNSGNYPIHLAAKAASPRVMSMLVDYKAALELPQIGHQQTALHLAAESHNVHVLRTLITKGASVSCVGGWEKKTALHSVVRDRVTADLAADKKYAAAEALILAGAPVNATDKFSRTPLHYAVAISPSQDEHDASADSTAEIVELLAQHGANMNAEATSTTGGNIPLRRAKWTPLHEAALCGDPAVIRKLVSRGAAIDAHDGEGETPLNAAAMRLFAKNKREERDWHAKVALQVIQALLDSGADATKAAGWPIGQEIRGMSTIEVAQGLKEQAKKAKQVARKKNDVYFRPKAAARHMEIAATMNGT
jgi:ankyrin repeat protein